MNPHLLLSTGGQQFLYSLCLRIYYLSCGDQDLTHFQMTDAEFLCKQCLRLSTILFTVTGTIFLH